MDEVPRAFPISDIQSFPVGNERLLLFAMIRSVVKSFKVPGVEVVASRMSNEAALTRMIDSTPKKTWSYLTLVLDG